MYKTNFETGIINKELVLFFWTYINKMKCSIYIMHRLEQLA